MQLGVHSSFGSFEKFLRKKILWSNVIRKFQFKSQIWMKDGKNLILLIFLITLCFNATLQCSCNPCCNNYCYYPGQKCCFGFQVCGSTDVCCVASKMYWCCPQNTKCSNPGACYNGKVEFTYSNVTLAK